MHGIYAPTLPDPGRDFDFFLNSKLLSLANSSADVDSVEADDGGGADGASLTTCLFTGLCASGADLLSPIPTVLGDRSRPFINPFGASPPCAPKSTAISGRSNSGGTKFSILGLRISLRVGLPLGSRKRDCADGTVARAEGLAR